MALSISAEGDQTAVLSTDHDVGSDTASGGYSGRVDVSALQAAETITVCLLTRTRAMGTGATERCIAHATLTGAPTTTYILTVEGFCDQGAKLRLKQTGGTGRLYPWKLLRTV